MSSHCHASAGNRTRGWPTSWIEDPQMATANFTTKPPMLDGSAQKIAIMLLANVIGIPSRCRSRARVDKSPRGPIVSATNAPHQLPDQRMSKLAIDELWACLCPSWNATTLLRGPTKIQRARKIPRCLNGPPARRAYSTEKQFEDRGLNTKRLEARSRHFDAVYNPSDREPAKIYRESIPVWKYPQQKDNNQEAYKYQESQVDLSTVSTNSLYNRLRLAAAQGEYYKTRQLVEFLVRERREKPSVEHYNALILSNVSADPGAAWRVHDLLAEMQQAGLQLDAATCHAALKVLAVHPDHLLRTDILDYMRSKWMGVSETGEHDIAAGLLREGLFEQALERLYGMQKQHMRVQGWLLDMFVYMLCEAGEVGEASSIMHSRHLGGELSISRQLWHYFLDKASAADHLDGTLLAWKTQVNLGYLNPSSGICLNVLTAASRAGDAYLATTVFTHLSKRNEPFNPLHYQLLIDAYLASSPPDLSRALNIITLMPFEKIQPTNWHTRSLFKVIHNSPELTHEALSHLRTLHGENRNIPIAAFNVLIESWIHQRNLPEALKIYKQIHTFAPQDGNAQVTFANIETFNLLLRGCRTTNPPDEAQASFLVAELLALRILPTALTYDRLILVFITAAQTHLETAAKSTVESAAEKSVARGKILLDWATRHFMDMQPLEWMPRFGTLEKLATLLAKVKDTRCWDVLQIAEEVGETRVEGWREKGKWAWKNAENAWEPAANAGGETAVVEEEKKGEERVEEKDDFAMAGYGG
jgi:hypothetical protein